MGLYGFAVVGLYGVWLWGYTVCVVVVVYGVWQLYPDDVLELSPTGVLLIHCKAAGRYMQHAC